MISEIGQDLVMALHTFDLWPKNCDGCLLEFIVGLSCCVLALVIAINVYGHVCFLICDCISLQTLYFRCDQWKWGATSLRKNHHEKMNGGVLEVV
jgi:hypothetical protein